MINLILDDCLVGTKRIRSQGFSRENFFFNLFEPRKETVPIINISPNGFFLKCLHNLLGWGTFILITIAVIVMVSSQILTALGVTSR